jgi:copper(I)-binding protein
MNNWYMFFKPNDLFKKGDNVKITFKSNKEFNNIVSIEKIEQKMKEITSMRNSSQPVVEKTGAIAATTNWSNDT